MEFQQFYLGCLAHASYLIGSDGQAAVVDPRRDVDEYMGEAKARGLAISYVVETHLHADFVSGYRELAERTGAAVVFGAKAEATFPHWAVREGDEIRVGRVVLRVLETPGHTPESISLVVIDTAQGPEPQDGPHRGHALHRRRGPARPRGQEGLLRGDHGRDALRLASRQAAEAAGCGRGLPGPRRGLALRAEHLQGDLVHHRRAAPDELRAPADAPGRVREADDRRPARGARLFPRRRAEEPRGRPRAGQPAAAARPRPRPGARARRRRLPPGRPARRRVRHRPRARLDQHRSRRPVRLLGGHAPGRGRAARDRGGGRGPGGRGGAPPVAGRARERGRLPRGRRRRLGPRRPSPGHRPPDHGGRAQGPPEGERRTAGGRRAAPARVRGRPRSPRARPPPRSPGARARGARPRAAHRRLLRGRLPLQRGHQPPPRHGFRDLRNVVGGTSAWTAAGYPTEPSSP